MPDLSFDKALLILIPLVSNFLPDVTQHIHSLRASGVISFHRLSVTGLEARAFRKSVGILCTTPEVTSFFTIIFTIKSILPN